MCSLLSLFSHTSAYSLSLSFFSTQGSSLFLFISSPQLSPTPPSLLFPCLTKPSLLPSLDTAKPHLTNADPCCQAFFPHLIHIAKSSPMLPSLLSRIGFRFAGCGFVLGFWFGHILVGLWFGFGWVWFLVDQWWWVFVWWVFAVDRWWVGMSFMIWFWVWFRFVIWFWVCFCLWFCWLGVEVVGGGGCGSGCGRWWLVVVDMGRNSGLGFAVGLREDKYTEKERGRDRLRIKKN